MLSSTLRGTLATIAMPFALSAAVGSEDQTPIWRPKLPLTDLKTGNAVSIGDLLFFASKQQVIGSADTSEKAIVTLLPEGASASASTMATSGEPVSLDWIAGPLVQVMELRQTPPEDLPNEAAIKVIAVAHAAQVILDLQDSQAPLPQIVPRGDGGLQFVWYTSHRDLEIEVRADGDIEIVEFDGNRNSRAKYTPEEAVAAVQRIREILESAS